MGPLGWQAGGDFFFLKEIDTSADIAEFQMVIFYRRHVNGHRRSLVNVDPSRFPRVKVDIELAHSI